MAESGRTSNEQLYDLAVLRKVHLLRLERAEAARVNALLADVERDLLDQIGAKLASGATSARLEALLTSTRDLLASGLEKAAESIQDVAAQVAVEEARYEAESIERVSPVTLKLDAVPLETLRALSKDPVQGLGVSDWFKGIEQQAVQRVERQLRLSVAEGQTVDQMVRAIRGTKENAYRDGVLNATKFDAEAIARTAVSQVSNDARQHVWSANSDVVLCLRWTSVLDGRTTAICRVRDGHLAPTTDQGTVPDDAEGPRLDPPSARPPAHINCRSIMIAVINPEGIVGNRPYVADDRVRRDREAQFRREAKERGVPIAQVRKEWAMEKVGLVPAKTTYADFFSRQSAEFQESVLGPARYAIYQKGGDLGAFVDNSGRMYTLAELAAS